MPAVLVATWAVGIGPRIGGLDSPSGADIFRNHVNGLLGIGLDDATASRLLPTPITMRRGEHIAAYFMPPKSGTWLQGIGPADVHNRDPRPISFITGGMAAVGEGVLGFADRIALSQIVPWEFNPHKQMNLKRTFRRASFLTTRIATNMGAHCSTPLLDRFDSPVSPDEKRWMDGFYLDTPEEWDDPYRFFEW